MNDLPTLYRLADGTQADPGDCKADDKGVMRHANGVPVVIDGDGKPVEIAREADENKAALAAKLGDDAEAAGAAAAQVAAKEPDAVMRAQGVNESKANEAPAKPADDGV